MATHTSVMETFLLQEKVITNLIRYKSMKKNYPNKKSRGLSDMFKLLFSKCLLLAIISIPSGNLYAQGAQKMISVKFENIELLNALQTINQLSDNAIIFVREEVLKTNKRVTLISSEILVKDAVTRCLSGTNLSVQQRGDKFVVTVTAPKPIIVKGVVLGDNRTPLGGVAVTIKGSTKGTATNDQGAFEMDLGSAATDLVFTMVGMETQTIHVTASEDMTVVLQETNFRMDDVVVTGYQTVEKRYLTSSVSTVNTKDLNIIGASSIDQMLQGQIAGLSVVNTSASPGAAPKVRVRGTATISGNADPLWVLDGVILENSVPISAAELNSPDVMSTFNSVIGGVSPQDIESITVLKDASATAIYGTRAANGVIVVTTKRGRRGAPSVSYSHTSKVSERPTYGNFNLLNSQQRVNLVRDFYDEGIWIYGSTSMENLMTRYYTGVISKEEYVSQARKLETMNTDWFDLLFRNAYAQTHDLSVSGGTEKTDYYISLSYNGEQGLDKTTQYNNLGSLIKVNTQIFKGVDMGFTIQAGRRDRDTYHQSIDPFEYAISTNRAIPIYDDNGEYYYYGGRKFNILNEYASTSRGSTQADLKGIMNLSVALLPGLKYNGLFSYSSSNSNSYDYATERSKYIATLRGYDYGAGTEEDIEKTKLPYGGTYNQTTYDQRTTLVRNSLEYKVRFLNDDFGIDVMAGQEFRTTSYNGLTSQNFGYMHDRGNIFYDPAETKEKGHISRNKTNRSLTTRSNVSYFGVASAMYKDLYVVNANIRFDGSNLFGSNPKYRYLPLWSVSGKWMIGNEAFFDGAREVVNHFALRASYGLRGNVVEDSSPQIIAQALPPNPLSGLLEMEILQAPNPDLKWETTGSLNIGLELGFLDNRISVTADYYQDYSRDLIAYRDFSSVSGFSGKSVNYADVKNEGVDISGTFQIIKGKNWQWTSTVNVGFVKNKVTKSLAKPQAKYLVMNYYTPGQIMEGHPINAMFSYKFAGLENGFVVDPENLIGTDLNGTPKFYGKDGIAYNSGDAQMAMIPNDVSNLQYSGTRDPQVTGGWNNVVRFKNWTLSTLFSFGLQYVVRLPEIGYADKPNSEQNSNASILDRWIRGQDNTGKTIPVIGGSGFFSVGNETFYTTKMYNQSQMSIVPGDYLRFRNLMLEYRLPARIANKIAIKGTKLQNFSLRFQAQNLFVIADKRLKGYDPETINYTTNGYGAMPLPRTYTLGLNINF